MRLRDWWLRWFGRKSVPMSGNMAAPEERITFFTASRLMPPPTRIPIFIEGVDATPAPFMWDQIAYPLGATIGSIVVKDTRDAEAIAAAISDELRIRRP